MVWRKQSKDRERYIYQFEHHMTDIIIDKLPDGKYNCKLSYTASLFNPKHNFEIEHVDFECGKDLPTPEEVLKRLVDEKLETTRLGDELFGRKSMNDPIEEWYERIYAADLALLGQNGKRK